MIYLASDQAGYELKENVKKVLKFLEKEYEDIGPYIFDPLDDYPDYILAAAKKVAEDLNKNRGIILGGSGQGEAMTANKVRGIRAVVFYGGPKEIIYLSREHNNANILSLGARFVEKYSKASIEEIVKTWLNTSFSREERHKRRIEKISKFENSIYFPNAINPNI